MAPTRRPHRRFPAAVQAWVLAATLGVFGARGAQAADPVAVLAAVKGKVLVVSAAGGAGTKGGFGRALERGDKVQVGPGGAATIFFSDGNVIELAEKSAMTVGGRISNLAAGPGAKLPGEVFAQVSRYATGGSRQTGLVALSAMRGNANASGSMPIAPRGSDVMTPRPAFAWRPLSGVKRYRVIVSGDAGPLWSREVSDSALAYPADAPALEGDRDYVWDIEALGQHGVLRKDSGAFHVVSAEAAAAVRSNLERIRDTAGGAESAAAAYLSGTYLFGRGLYHDAAAQFGTLTRLSPESPAPHEALGNVYRAVGLTDLAAAEFDRALALSRERSTTK